MDLISTITRQLEPRGYWPAYGSWRVWVIGHGLVFLTVLSGMFLILLLPLAIASFQALYTRSDAGCGARIIFWTATVVAWGALCYLLVGQAFGGSIAAWHVLVIVLVFVIVSEVGYISMFGRTSVLLYPLSLLMGIGAVFGLLYGVSSALSLTGSSDVALALLSVLHGCLIGFAEMLALYLPRFVGKHLST